MITAVEQQSLRFWLSTWIPENYAVGTTYQLLPRDDGRWTLTVYPTNDKERTGTMWGVVEDGKNDIQIVWDD